MLESVYQTRLINKLNTMFPGAVILKNDPTYIQGFPDLTILYNDRWVELEVKASENSPEQPNQRYYVELLDKMSYASFIYPEIEGEVLYEIQRSFAPRR